MSIFFAFLHNDQDDLVKIPAKDDFKSGLPFGYKFLFLVI